VVDWVCKKIGAKKFSGGGILSEFWGFWVVHFLVILPLKWVGIGGKCCGMMTAAEIRQSFIDFFKEKEHTAVPSASLMPQSPGLLFTNAGMNQFVPYFLGTEKAPYSPPRAADTQKCIRAGGKHNDLEDVGYDTYHHTFFEMLGNWSFGDYFKKEAIEWAWELVVERWGLPASRLYATVYAPSEGDPSEFDQEAYDLWAALFTKAGLDPAKQIINGNVKDNFWMMGETGPCGPCSELHVDMTPAGDSEGKLVNMDSDLCIEIWNLVFIQYNAEADGTFRDLPAKHVDTGMGFERACSLIQNTKGFTDFSEKPTNYATDVFQPIFRKLEALSGKSYSDIYPGGESSQALDEAIAFRVIADHIRTLSFSIADGILPGNTGRNYVLRRILRRAVKYGRALGFGGNEAFLPELVDTLVAEFGGIFPEVVTRAKVIKETLENEEQSFNKTLDRGLELFTRASSGGLKEFPPAEAFKLYDTYGFPVDLTALLCRERGLTLNEEAAEVLMEQAREVSRGAQKKTIVRALDISSECETAFVGFNEDSCVAKVLEIHEQDENLYVITDKTVLFTEMGGQEGDTGTAGLVEILGTQKIGHAMAHIVAADSGISVGDTITISLDRARRAPIEAHHSATHLLHWALHEVVSQEATQQGSSVSPDRLRFDFNSAALTKEQVSAIEKSVNEKIAADETVSWKEVLHADIKGRADIMQFFGDKYGDLVRVVQIGGEAQALNGYSMELCGGTHVRKTSDIGLFKIKSEGAIAAGIRRIEAVCGAAASAYVQERIEALNAEIAEWSAKLTDGAPVFAGDHGSIEDLEAHCEAVKTASIETDKAAKKLAAAEAAGMAGELMEGLIAEAGASIVAKFDGEPELLQELLNTLKKQQYAGVGVLALSSSDGKAHLGVYVHGSLLGTHKAGDLVQRLAPIIGGKGGGRPDMARGAGSDQSKIDELLAEARGILG
jgi:alanyl-tRNA synthetase